MTLTTDMRGPDHEWQSCSSCAPWVKNSLLVHAQESRQTAAYLRKRHAGKFYAEPAEFLAATYDEIAAVFERRLAELSSPVSPDIEEPS